VFTLLCDGLSAIGASNLYFACECSQGSGYKNMPWKSTRALIYAIIE
jgi:hypothetical protein